MEQLVDRYLLFPDVCDTRWYEEKWAKKFVNLKTAFFFEMFVSVDLLGPEERILSFAQ